ncbi:Succinate--CoA ligase [Clarias magur]|uniref:Succinate--CoA ligase n=1 Tax=Clarias magur TaxID=1594786 RepID=A0A8J4WWI4_CLAMG|nr:Succinate--CoA ligase [Clarias magur]
MDLKTIESINHGQKLRELFCCRDLCIKKGCTIENTTKQFISTGQLECNPSVGSVETSGTTRRIYSNALQHL